MVHVDICFNGTFYACAGFTPCAFVIAFFSDVISKMLAGEFKAFKAQPEKNEKHFLRRSRSATAWPRYRKVLILVGNSFRESGQRTLMQIEGPHQITIRCIVMATRAKVTIALYTYRWRPIDPIFGPKPTISSIGIGWGLLNYR